MPTKDPTLFGTPIAAKYVRKAEATRAKYARKYGYTGDAKYTLSAVENPLLGPCIGVKNLSTEPGEPLDAKRGVAIGTIRMGYGHYRIGMALASAANALGYTPYWFDLLAYDTAGARMIHDLDKLYSLGSRLSQKSKLFNALIWDPMLGKWYKRAEKNYPIMAAAEVFSDIFRALPPDMPVLGTHPWNALGAVHAGMTKVVNVIPDNCPLGFHIVDGALQTVQSPSSYFRFRSFLELGPEGRQVKGVPADRIRMTGHYVDDELVKNIETDCAARVRRGREKLPRRALISIGGAGAQRDLLLALARHLIARGDTALFVNFGDHTNAWDFFRKNLPGFEASAVRHFDWDGAKAFAAEAVSGEVAPGVHAFLNADPFAAVYTTNLLMSAADILITKPSELAFYPVPKLLLERVGGHEAWGAVRSSEIGDGTVECRGQDAALHALDMLLDEPDLIEVFCECILKQRDIGTYNGAYRAVELAVAGIQ